MDFWVFLCRDQGFSLAIPTFLVFNIIDQINYQGESNDTNIREIPRSRSVHPHPIEATQTRSN
jgi:hypothetical protein